MSAMYACYHGPDGLRNIALRAHTAALVLAKGLRDSGNVIENDLFFDTLRVTPAMAQSEIRHHASQKEINLRFNTDGSVSSWRGCYSALGS